MGGAHLSRLALSKGADLFDVPGLANHFNLHFEMVKRL
jgi:hypothetical protein